MDSGARATGVQLTEGRFGGWQHPPFFQADAFECFFSNIDTIGSIDTTMMLSVMRPKFCFTTGMLPTS